MMVVSKTHCSESRAHLKGSVLALTLVAGRLCPGSLSPGPRFINLKRYELVLIAHLHMRIVKIQRVVQSARILPIHVKEGNIRGKSTSFYFLVSGRPRSRELRDLVSFQLDKTGPWTSCQCLYNHLPHQVKRERHYKVYTRTSA